MTGDLNQSSHTRNRRIELKILQPAYLGAHRQYRLKESCLATALAERRLTLWGEREYVTEALFPHG
jgi:hypothetical protein